MLYSEFSVLLTSYKWIYSKSTIKYAVIKNRNSLHLIIIATLSYKIYE
jgi:hypothetical protein